MVSTIYFFVAGEGLISISIAKIFKVIRHPPAERVEKISPAKKSCGQAYD